MSKRILLALLFLAFELVPYLHGAEYQLLRDTKGKTIGSITQSATIVSVRDTSGNILWQQQKEPQVVVQNNIEVKQSSESKGSLLGSILAVPFALTAVVLLIPVGLAKTAAESNL